MAEKQDYPVPQTEVNTAREVSAAAKETPAAPQAGDGSVEVSFSEVGHAAGGMVARFGRALGAAAKKQAKRFGKESMEAVGNLAAQGPNEIANALLGGHAYSAASPSLFPDVGEGIHGKAAEAAPETEQPAANGYQVFGQEAAPEKSAGTSYREMVEEQAHLGRSRQIGKDKGISL